MNMMPKFKNKLKVVLVIAILFMGVVGKAQFRVMVTPSLEIPIVFQGNPGYNNALGIKVGGFYEWRKFSLGLSVGYQSFSPSKKTMEGRGLPLFRLDNDFIYAENRSCSSCEYTEEFSNLTVIPFLIEWNHYLLKTEKIKLSLGLNVGFRIYSYSHVIRLKDPIEKNYDPYSYPPLPQEMIEGVITTNKIDVRLNLSPKIAIEYQINNLFSLYFEPTINLQTKRIEDYLGLDDDFFDIDNGEIYPGWYKVNQMFTSSLAVGVIYNFGYPSIIPQ